MWRLPPTVISEDLIPRGREMQAKGQNVLVKFGIDAYAGGKKVDPAKINWDKVTPGTYSYSQQPGKENPLGFLKINFDSAHSVYMHDTPSDRIFGRNFRSESSGCIRVHNIENLAAWLLADQRGWDAERIAEMKDRPATRRSPEKAGATSVRLYQRLGDRRRRRAVSPRHLSEGRIGDVEPPIRQPGEARLADIWGRPNYGCPSSATR